MWAPGLPGDSLIKPPSPGKPGSHTQYYFTLTRLFPESDLVLKGSTIQQLHSHLRAGGNTRAGCGHDHQAVGPGHRQQHAAALRAGGAGGITCFVTGKLHPHELGAPRLMFDRIGKPCREGAPALRCMMGNTRTMLETGFPGSPNTAVLSVMPNASGCPGFIATRQNFICTPSFSMVGRT